MFTLFALLFDIRVFEESRSRNIGDERDIVKIFDKFIRVRVSVGLELVCRLHDAPVECRRYARLQLYRRYYLLIDMLESYCYRVVSVKRNLSCEHLIHDYSQRVDIRTFVYIVAPCLFRREVMDGSDDLAAGGKSRVINSSGDTEVSEFYHAVVRYHYIVRLYVSVDDLVLVSDPEGRGYLLGNVDDLAVVHRSFSLDDLVESISLDKLHYYVVDVAFTAYIIDAYDIRMRKTGRGLRLSFEVLNECRVLGEFGS